MTFDGYVAGENDEIDWIKRVHKREKNTRKFDFSSFTSKVGAIIVGKNSYTLGVEQGWFKDQAYGSSPLFVVCHRIPQNRSQDADFRFITKGIKEVHRQASKTAGKKWVYLFGGADVFQQFLNRGLVDEIHITIAPILIGKGIRLFENLTEKHRELQKISIKHSPNGMIETKYKVVK